MLTRREFIGTATTGIAATVLPDRLWGSEDFSLAKITKIEIVR